MGKVKSDKPDKVLSASALFRLTLLGLSRTDSWPTVTRNLSVNPLKPLANTFCLLFRQFRVPFSSFSLSLLFSHETLEKLQSMRLNGLYAV